MTALPARKPKTRKPAKARKVPRRCKPHLKFVGDHACSGCGTFGTDDNPVEAAHLRLGTGGGMGLKPADRWVISLCHRCHHGEQHQKGERTFWDRRDVDPKALAEEFARKSPHWPKLREMP